MNYVSYIKWYVLHRYFDCKQEISTKHLKINVCEDVTTANIMISYLFWIFDYNLRCDSLKKEYPANFLPFRRHFWRDSNGGLPLSFYWNVGKKKRQDKCSQNRSHRQDIHTKTNRNMHRHTHKNKPSHSPTHTGTDTGTHIHTQTHTHTHTHRNI